MRNWRNNQPSQLRFIIGISSFIILPMDTGMPMAMRIYLYTIMMVVLRAAAHVDVMLCSPFDYLMFLQHENLIRRSDFFLPSSGKKKKEEEKMPRAD